MREELQRRRVVDRSIYVFVSDECNEPPHTKQEILPLPPHTHMFSNEESKSTKTVVVHLLLQSSCDGSDDDDDDFSMYQSLVDQVLLDRLRRDNKRRGEQRNERYDKMRRAAMISAIIRWRNKDTIERTICDGINNSW